MNEIGFVFLGFGLGMGISLVFRMIEDNSYRKGYKKAKQDMKKGRKV